VSGDRLRQLVRGLGALAGLLALVVGVPVALVAVAGWPLPHTLRSRICARHARLRGQTVDRG
jgi:hypothetical protein